MLLTYNNQALPGTMLDHSKPVAVRSRVAQVLRGGSYSQGGLLDARHISVKGLIKCYSIADQQAKEDDLNSKLRIGVLAPLVFVPGSGRHFTAEVEGVSVTRDPQKMKIEYEASFLVPAGYAEADTDITVNLATNGGTLNYTAGNHETRPRFSITVGASGGTVTLLNNATGEALSFSPSAAGARTLDTDLETITLSSSVDATAEWLSGDFPRLVPGSNAFTLTATGTTITAFSILYRPRWR